MMKKFWACVLTVALLSLLCSCGTEKTNTSNSIEVSETASLTQSNEYEGLDPEYYVTYPEPTPTPTPTIEEITEEATHIVYAVCNIEGVEIKGDEVTFSFTVCKVLKGEIEQHSSFNNQKINCIRVVGSVDDYSLSNTYAPGSMYILWLKQYVHDESAAVYENEYRFEDLLPTHINLFRFIHLHELYDDAFDTFVDQMLNDPINVYGNIEDFEKVFSAWEEKNKQNESEYQENSSQTPSSN